MTSSAYFIGIQVISQPPLQWLQCAGWPKVEANSHSCDSLLHCTMAWEMMSSEWQCEQTGVNRAACRLTTLAGLANSLVQIEWIKK